MVKFKGKLFIIALVFLGLMISSQAMAAVCNVPSGPYLTIQAAVSAPACNPINVAAGTYTEQLTINRSLTLQGAGSGSTTIVAPAIMTTVNVRSGTQAMQGVVNAIGATSHGITVNISGFTVDGNYQAPAVSATWFAGIVYSDADGTIENNTITKVRQEPLGDGSASWRGHGIWIGDASTVTVDNNTITEWQRNGIEVRDAAATATVTNNTITGYTTQYTVVNGITFYSATDGTVSGNTVTACQYTGAGSGNDFNNGTQACAIMSYDCTGTFIVSGNTVSNNDMGIYSRLSSAGIITDNTVENNLYFGIVFRKGDVTATCNTITGSEVGVLIPSLRPASTSAPTANFNNIYGNTVLGMRNDANYMTNAENNWWGCAAGPGNPGCDPVSGNVDFIPWLQAEKLMNWKDYNGADPGGYMPDIDQNQDFDKVIVRTEETGAGVSFSGTWTVYTNQQNASGGTLKYSNDLVPPGASCSFTFNGTSISWIGFKQNNMGISEVYIDGQLDATVDLYNGVSLWKQVLYTNNNLSHGQHTITIKPTNQQNPLSQGLYTGVDAFDVDNKEQHYCAPVAEANSLWWLDKKYENIEIFSTPLEGTGYVGGDINQDGNSDILDLVQELAIMMKTNQGHTGTTVEDEQDGIDAFLAKYQLGDKLYEHTVLDSDFPDPMPGHPPYIGWENFFHYLEGEVERSQDVKLDLGFWHILVCDEQAGQILWQRVGGHAVTVAGVDSQNLLFAISDPDNDAAETGGLGVIRPVPGGHPLHPNDTSIHNIEANASHDIYTVWHSPSPGGKMGLLNYPPKFNLPPEEPKWAPWPNDFTECIPSQVTLTEIEAAVIVSPKICGNKVVDPGEECDDGNLINGDGCDDQCKIPDISVSPSSLAFGKVIAGLSSTSKTVTVKNDGNGKLKIGTISLGGTNPNQFSIPVADDHCSGQLVAPSLSCTVAVKFSPTSAGAKSATLSIPSDDPNENPVSVSLSGNGVKVIVTSPNGGESWKWGTPSHSITWSTSSTIAPAVATTKLLYTMNGGTTWKTISSFPGNPGIYTWYIPKVTSTKNKCKVKVVLKNAANVTIGSDISDKFFTIK